MNATNDRSGLLRRKRYSILDISVLCFVILGTFVLASESLARLFLEQTAIPQTKLAERLTAKDSTTFHGDYQFSDDMFTPNIPVWEAALKSYQGEPNVNYLEVGVHEGRSVIWMVENILTHPTSRLTGVDIFSDEYKGVKGGYKAAYLANLEAAGAADRATTIEGFSQIELRRLSLGSFDIIYIDGSHANADVLEDAVLCNRLLKAGGLLIFDDYGFGGGTGQPKVGIDAFFRFYGEQFETLHNDYQVILRKKT